MEEKKTVFETLSKIDVSGKAEKKNGLTYLSWAWAWNEVKKIYPKANYEIISNKDGLNYHHDNKTCWVVVSVNIEGLVHTEHLPVMNFRNQSIKESEVTSFDVNKSIQRALTKAIGRHGLGLYIYAGEDLPEVIKDPNIIEKYKKALEKTDSIEKVTALYKANEQEIKSDLEILKLFTQRKTELAK